jgi:hypothetical protein
VAVEVVQGAAGELTPVIFRVDLKVGGEKCPPVLQLRERKSATIAFNRHLKATPSAGLPA